MDYFHFTMVFLVPLMVVNAILFLITAIMLIAPGDNDLYPSRVIHLAFGISLFSVSWLGAAIVVCLEVPL